MVTVAFKQNITRKSCSSISLAAYVQTTVSEPFVGVSPCVSGMELLVSRIEGSVDIPFSPLPLRLLLGLAWPLASAGKLVCPMSLWLPALYMCTHASSAADSNKADTALCKKAPECPKMGVIAVCLVCSVSRRSDFQHDTPVLYNSGDQGLSQISTAKEIDSNSRPVSIPPFTVQ